MCCSPATSFGQQLGLYALDDDVVQLESLQVAGLGGVVGNTAKAFRRSRPDFAGALTGLLRARPDFLLCHEGFNSHHLEAEPEVHEALAAAPDVVFVHGHRHGEPVQTLPTGHQILNACERVIILVPES